MSTTVAIAWGVVLGALGAAWHLGVTWARARLVVERRGLAFALALLPIALAGPALAVVVAAKTSHVSAWVTVIGLVAVRSYALRRRR